MMNSTGSNRSSSNDFFVSLQQFKNLLDEIYSLDSKVMKKSWHRSQWKEIALNWSSYKLALVESDESLNCFALWHTPDTSCAHLLKVATNPIILKKGLSYTLLEEASSQFKALSFDVSYLEVAVDNKPAIGLYTKLGFQILHRKKSFYSDGTDAYAMHLKLN